MRKFYSAITAPSLIFALVSATLSPAHAYDASNMKETLERNITHCKVNQSHIKRDTPFSTQIEMTNTELSRLSPNTFRLKNKIWSLNLEAIKTGKVSRLKSFTLNLASTKSFTKIKPFKPETFHGQKPSWLATYPPFQEGQFELGMMLHVMAQSYAILEPHLSENEKRIFLDWGDAAIKELTSRPKLKGAYDIRASMAAGLTTWGLVSGRKDANRKGKALYNEVIRSTDTKGRVKKFIDPSIYYGKELRYLHMTNGFLAITAWALYRAGDGSILADIKRRGNLVDGINFSTLAVLDASFREGISPKQIEVDEMRSQTSSTYWQSFAYLEYMAALGLTEKDLPALRYTNQIKKRGGGYYSGFHGGYTSCLLP